MQEYPVERGYYRDLPGSIERALRECFGVEPVRVGDRCRLSYGALKQLEAAPGKEGKTLVVHTESDLDAPDDVILDTNRRFRAFLDAVTGYSTKERVKRAKGTETE